MPELKGTKTEANLAAAFAGESQARNKYTFYADVARKNGYEQIAAIFEETANNEKAHAEIWFRLLHGNPDTDRNLSDAADGEKYEFTSMYPTFAEVAREEGFEHIARKFEQVALVEKDHESRFRHLLANIETGLVFSKQEENAIWVCRNCGHMAVGKDAPQVCPVCGKPQAYFEQPAKNF